MERLEQGGEKGEEEGSDWQLAEKTGPRTDGGGSEKHKKVCGKKFLSDSTRQKVSAQVSNFMALPTALPVVGAVALFSNLNLGGVRMGHGKFVFDQLEDKLWMRSQCCLFAVVSTFLLYICDASYWKGCYKHIRNVVLGMSGLAFFAAVVLSTKTKPVAPIACYLLVYPFWLWGLKHLFYRRFSPARYLAAAASFLFITSLVCMGLWVWWILDDNMLEDDEDYQALKCYEGTHNQELADLKQMECQAAYIQWVSPAVFGAGTMVFSFVSYFLYRTLHNAETGIEQHKLARHSTAARVARMDSIMRMVLAMIILIVVALWVAASVNGASHALSNVVTGFAVSVGGCLVATVVAFVGVSSIKKSLFDIPLLKKMQSTLTSDWVKAMAFYFAPLYLLFLLVSLLNQFVRMHLPRSVACFNLDDILMQNTTGGASVEEVEGMTKETELEVLVSEQRRVSKARHSRDDAPSHPPSEAGSEAAAEKLQELALEREHKRRAEGLVEEAKSEYFKSPFTAVANRQLMIFKGWNWTSVYTKAIYLGMAFLVLNVGVGKVVVIFLTWLNDYFDRENFSFPTIVAMFYFIGLFMFLLPPVPGVPVYLAGGVILTKAGEKQFGSFWTATAFNVALCFVIKLNAVGVQQKVFGEGMSRFVTIRKLVGVNSVSIRAIKCILQEPGLSLKKVAILCGGPDWPTSVLTGILKLRLLQMLIGSLPVVLLIAPCVMAGAFQLKIQEGGKWESMASVALAAATLAQTFALVAAMHFIEQVASARHDELEQEPDDEEVKASERVAQAKARIYVQNTVWHAGHFPRAVKVLLRLSTACMMACCYVIMFGSSQCFEPYELTSSIDGNRTWTRDPDVHSDEPPGLDGDVLNVIKPVGWVVVYLFLGSSLCIILFKVWASLKLSCCPLKDAELKDITVEKGECDESGEVPNPVAEGAGLSENESEPAKSKSVVKVESSSERVAVTQI